MTYDHQDEWVVDINAPQRALFEYLDDQARLGGHMEKPSAMMMGGRMAYEFDESKGRAVGGAIKMTGEFLGLKVYVSEIVTERKPPLRKIWETRGEQRLVVMDAYRMGFDISSIGAHRSRLRVFIDYSLPKSFWSAMLGFLFAPIFARWCVKRMAEDAKGRFAAQARANISTTVGSTVGP